MEANMKTTRPWHQIGSSGVNADLQRERNTATFNSYDLACLLYGGSDTLGRRRAVISRLFENEAFDPKDQHFQSLSERYDAAIKKAVNLLSIGFKEGWEKEDFQIAVDAIRSDVAIGVHAIMFVPAIERLATNEQREKWLPAALTLKMIGTYAQTELGHGTNLRELQTTAMFDRDTDEFVLNTPLPTGMKWWPGGLGKSCNHVILLAQLSTNGKACGMQAFMVQIRDMDTHQPLPGIEVGDIGPKLGIHAADNGYLILHDVRIPRTNMLMRYNQVTRDGEFVTSSAATRATYGTMVMVRAKIVEHASGFVMHSCTVATRYSAVRRQSELKPGAGEVQVMDFQTQQHKLFPNIALGYALFFARQYISETYNHMYTTQFSKGDYSNVPELHSQTCCLKAFSTEMSCDALSTLRRACGGHGFLLSSGVADVFTDAQAGMTYEGENTVMYLQTARYLMKAIGSAMQGEQMSGSSSYLGQQLRAVPINSAADCLSSELLKAAFTQRALYMVRNVADHLQRELSSGTPQHIAWDNNAVSLVRAAKAHIDSFVAVMFLSAVDEVKTKPEIKSVLQTLSRLYALNRIVANSGEFLESGALSSKQIDMIRQQEVALLPQIRPNAVALVDAFDFHDMSLNSTLGSYDGQCYERLRANALRNPMNKTNVHPSYFKYIKEFRKAAISAKL